MDVLETETIAILAFEDLEDALIGEKIHVVGLCHTFTSPHKCKLVQRFEHRFGHLVMLVQITLSHSFIQPIAKSNFTDGNVKVTVGAILETNVGIVEHREFDIVRFLTFVSLVKTVHRIKLTAKSLDDIHPHFSVDYLESTKEVKFPVTLLLFRKHPYVQLRNGFQTETCNINLFEVCLN